MSYFNTIGIYGAGDTPSVDAFGRFRISSPTTIFESKQLDDSVSLFWLIKTIGNATSSYVQSHAGTLLMCTGSNSSIIRQSKQRMNYQPAKSQEIVMTSNFTQGVNGVVKRVGYFDGSNGIYFVQSGSSFGVGLRSGMDGIVADTFISQSNWNKDKFDGSGPSGAILNITASQIYFADFEWLGVGRIRYGIFNAGVPHYVHEIYNTNTLTSVYMSSPNLPIRYESNI